MWQYLVTCRCACICCELLCAGIGVDDMFVIVQALECLDSSEKALPIPERIATALKHAGVSITVTSLTDILAFGVGATTVSVRAPP